MSQTYFWEWPTFSVMPVYSYCQDLCIHNISFDGSLLYEQSYSWLLLLATQTKIVLSELRKESTVRMRGFGSMSELCRQYYSVTQDKRKR